MNQVHDQNDCEQGQETPLVMPCTNSSIDDKTSPSRTKTAILASCALGAFLMATATHLPTSQIHLQTLPQEHRRLAVQSQRHLSAISRMQDVFSVIFVSSIPEDDIGFGKGGDFSEEAAAASLEQCPGHNMGFKGLYMEVPQIWSPTLGQFGMDAFTTDGRNPERTFAVEPNHTVLEGGTGVVFNVEEVPDALPQDLNKKRIAGTELEASLIAEAAEFYSVEVSEKRSKNMMSSGPSIEVMSRMPVNLEDGSGVVFASGQGFLAACMTAFAHHLPLRLSPDDLWTVISNGFARHVDQHAEELRANFVDHEGKQEIRIREDSMIKGKSPPEQWEELIFPKFEAEISRNVNDADMFETLAGRNFTTSTASSQAASTINLMATMKNYFEFRMDTMCGIPNVHLDGTRADWESLRERTKTLALYMLQDNSHGDLWIYDIVLPILDEFLRSYDGEPNYCFWQNMVKFRTSGSGSGSFDFLSGWLHTLFPYLATDGGLSRPNPYLKPWLESASAHQMGPKPDEIPIQLSSVPVQWMYHDVEYPMHFHAGFRGVRQEADGTISPIIGWYVTEDP